MKPLLHQDVDRLLTADQERELVELLPQIGRKPRPQAGRQLGGTHPACLEIGHAVWEKLPLLSIGWIDVRIRVNGDVVLVTPANGLWGTSTETDPGNLE